MRVALLFEQSGTFKKEFISRGHIAHDYDIQNKFGQTDYVMNLFHYINNTDMRTINTYDFAMAFSHVHGSQTSMHTFIKVKVHSSKR